ncbi:hypothetical protein BYT27DRAFT_7220056 [Phlegmacium glaucopus]|nr:hypothetical protein BYT27DRAFT_7220056 [Phlegmacium glaucopus]
MTRGRKKDLTIPPSRTLAQQRDYRARKAHYIASLEERCRKAEQENIQLRKELDEAKALLTTPAILHPETAEASSELMHNLTVATASLAKFQRLAFASTQSSNERPGIQTSNESIAVQPERRQASDTAHGAAAIRRNRPYQEDSSTTLLQPSYHPSLPVYPRLSPDMDSECCGGLLDCTHLLDKDLGSYDHVIDRDPGSKTTSRLSDLRSTSDYSLE